MKTNDEDLAVIADLEDPYFRIQPKSTFKIKIKIKSIKKGKFPLLDDNCDNCVNNEKCKGFMS